MLAGALLRAKMAKPITLTPFESRLANNPKELASFTRNNQILWGIVGATIMLASASIFIQAGVPDPWGAIQSTKTFLNGIGGFFAFDAARIVAIILFGNIPAFIAFWRSTRLINIQIARNQGLVPA